MGCLLMINLFKKKDSATEKNDPPLPENLDESNISENNSLEQNLPPLPDTNNQQNTHDNIPNDISINNNSSSFSPDSLPDVDDDENQENTNLDDNSDMDEPELPPLPSINTGSSELPDIPSVDDAPNPEINTSSVNINDEIKTEDNSSNASDYIAKEPVPEVDDEIPQPPAIFSDEGIQKTSEEITDMANKSSENSSNIFSGPSETTDDYKIENSYSNERNEFEQSYESNNDFSSKNIISSDDNVVLNEIRSKKRGPIFVDINSFKTMLDGIDTIKSDIKLSEDVLQNLTKIKDSKDKELEKWRLQLEDIQRKISYVDKVIFNEV